MHTAHAAIEDRRNPESGPSDGRPDSGSRDAEDTMRPSYQDDTYLVGEVSASAACWPQTKPAMLEAGHELNTTKSELWIPGCDDVPSSGLSSGVQEL